MIDLHSHLLPAVDDGAADGDEAQAALRLLAEEGATDVVVTPHVRGSATLTADEREWRLAELDLAWQALTSESDRAPPIAMYRGAEVMLDVPEPDLSDPRLRLAGTEFVLVEFPFLSIPHNSVAALAGILGRGYRPVVAHPERYRSVSLDAVAAWRSAGALLQVNCGSLLGQYGRAAMKMAWCLLESGTVDYLSTDYHARGPVHIQDAHTRVVRRGGDDVATLLLEENARLLLKGEAPRKVPPLASRRRWPWQGPDGVAAPLNVLSPRP